MSYHKPEPPPNGVYMALSTVLLILVILELTHTIING